MSSWRVSCPRCGAGAEPSSDRPDGLACPSCGLGLDGPDAKAEAPSEEPLWELVEPDGEASEGTEDAWTEPVDPVRRSETFSWLDGDDEASYETAPEEPVQAVPAEEPTGTPPEDEATRWWDDPTRRKQVREAAVAGVVAFLVLFSVWLVLDLDDDGLRAYQELGMGANPFSADSDGDGLEDGWEHRAGLSPTDADMDGDEVNDGLELRLGSDPKVKDSDGDGLDDGQEVALGTDPTKTDTDGDGLSDKREAELGTDPLKMDSDDDGLDDLHEVVYGTDPRDPDTDGDGLPDGDEVALGADPFKGDTDDDGIPDVEEARLPMLDCNGNGVFAIAEWDDDGDGLKDALERPEHRCDPDVDKDGVLDGDEGAFACVAKRDCDGDGLGDGVEFGTEFDHLLADTFDVGLFDAVSWSFKQNGQEPSRDDDDDGIPDSWEQTNGLIEWGAFRPTPGDKDMLVEFVRVQGPDSGRYAGLDMSDAYRRVADTFRLQGDIRMQYVETRVHLPQESRPPLIPSSHASYYHDVLAKARHSTNPYVTTVVLNPQHDISEIAHSGAAPIRGMLATVDYGQFTTLRFEDDNGTLLITPYLESAIAGGRDDVLTSMGFLDGGIVGGEYHVQKSGYRVYWTPFWFKTEPRIEFDDGRVLTLPRAGGEVKTAELASTILHELGHTLGLCHTHDTECRSALSMHDQSIADESTMSYLSASTALRFLDSEWTTIDTYLTCPPEETVVATVESADAATLIDLKYGYALEDILSVDSRACGVFAMVTREYEPDLDPLSVVPAYVALDATAEADPASSYTLASVWAEPVRGETDVVASAAFVVFTLFAVTAAAAGQTLRRLWRGDT